MRVRHCAGFVVTAFLVTIAAGAEPIAKPDPLLTIDRARDTVVDRIVLQWHSALSYQAESELRARLWAARADNLFAASLAPSLADVNALLADGEQRVLESTRVNVKAIGDANADLVYTPISPCRIADTRGAGGGVLLANAARTFDGFSANFSTQGGTASNCGMPNAVAAIAMNVYAVNPTNWGSSRSGRRMRRSPRSPR